MRARVLGQASTIMGRVEATEAKVASAPMRLEGKPTVRTKCLPTLGVVAAVEAITAPHWEAQAEGWFA